MKNILTENVYKLYKHKHLFLSSPVCVAVRHFLHMREHSYRDTSSICLHYIKELFKALQINKSKCDIFLSVMSSTVFSSLPI